RTVAGAGCRTGFVPVLDNQEMLTDETGGIIYWEGAVSLAGQSGEREVSGGGYVELTGYAGSLGGKF
ncbi:MAG: carotenoid 1,2-hydratase, partial [Proteobacteria bacterium]|nr:carotenoid 1,2-hydratase [Pseudomonadota bacterium]